MLLAHYGVCNSKEKQEEKEGLLSRFGKVPIIDPLLT